MSAIEIAELTEGSILDQFLLGRNQDELTSQDLSKALKDLRDRYEVRDLLAHYKQNDRLAQIANRSYHHSNGFDKIVLEETGFLALRLHVWWKGFSNIDSDIHNHNFDFASWIILGRMQNTLFTEAENGLARTRYRYDIDGSLEYSMQPECDVHLKIQFISEHAVHSIYSIDHSVVHSGDPNIVEPTSTLVLQRSRPEMSNLIYRAEEKAQESDVDAVSCSSFTSKEVAEKLNRLDRMVAGEVG
ncbi:MAG: hypothetical protein ABJN34_13835 [Litoreibacter sp.]|uniref:hypothetical protein n=1 Tax=Litoreibacter sp. TaxID=1969459 RepID=UPI003299C871